MIHLFFDFQQHFPDIVELLDHLKVMNGVVFVFFHLQLGTLQGQAPLLDQVINDMKIVYVLLGKKPVALFILLGFNNIKLLLPETNK